MKITRSPEDPRRGFKIGDDQKPAPAPATETLAQADALAREDGLVHYAVVETRLRCLEALVHLQFRTNDAKTFIAAAAELEEYALHGKPLVLLTVPDQANGEPANLKPGAVNLRQA